MIHVFSKGIRKIENISIFLKEEIEKYGDIVFHSFWHNPKPKRGDIVVGWGHKKTANKAREYAKKKGLSYISLEDGFLRSLKLGCEGEQPLSLSVDRVGVYYDAGSPSDVETLLSDMSWCTEETRERARECMRRMKIYDLSKYNNAPSFTSRDKSALYHKIGAGQGKKLILVVDQTAGDASIALGQASPSSFTDMLEAARSEPNSVVVVKTHPDVVAGKKASCFEKIPEDVYVVSESFAPLSFLEAFDEVYTVTSQMGFDALMAGKKVHTFGVSFYAGWGLTVDHAEIPARRRTQIKLEELFAALYFKVCRYVNPVTGLRITLDEAIDILAARRKVNERNRRRYIAVGFRGWKHPHVRAFAGSTVGEITFVRSVNDGIDQAAREGQDVLIWAGKATNDVVRRCASMGVRLWRMEDGFLRSVGLGVDYHAPYSLVLDDSGIYFDPECISHLTKILCAIKNHPDLPRLLERSAKLMETICREGLSKYNTASDPEVVNRLKALPKDRTIVLVPGQVDGDASVVRGGGSIQSNEMLLQAVRRANPKAYILYKPHPDVISKNREGCVSQVTLDRCTDLIVTSGSLEDFWPYVDEVHTLTSLSGFEALLRRKRVVTYGKPFYAGWGLTQDHVDLSQHRCTLILTELIAGVMILYPDYWDWKTSKICRPEDVCFRLIRKETPSAGVWIHICRIAKVVRRLMKNR